MEAETRAVWVGSRSVSATLNQKCRPNVQYEYLCYRIVETLARMDQLHCDCPSNCREHKFEIQMSQVPWPTQIYENHLRKSLLANGFIKSFPSIRDALTKIEISLGHTQRVLMKEEKDVTWQQLLMQIGALSALTVGVSLVTGVEIVWLICRLFFQCVRGRHEDKQVQAMTMASYPEFDDLGFNWYSLQSPEADQQEGGGRAGGGQSSEAMLTTETELTPPLAPNPIVEESDVDIRAMEGLEESNLYTHAWERSGQSRPYTRVLVSEKDANISDAPPLLNAPANQPCVAQNHSGPLRAKSLWIGLCNGIITRQIASRWRRRRHECCEI